MSKNNPLSNLLTKAQTAEESLSNKGAVPTNEENEETSELIISKNEKTPSGKKGLTVYFNRRVDKSTEPTRLPELIHRKLKLISLVSGISIEALVANIIEEMLKDNEKEINIYLKKNLI